ncbi:hypothetical protein D3C78_1487740 [compost metagenome]
MDERRLRQRRQQLVGRVGGEHRRRVGLVIERIAAHGEAPAIQWIEACVAVPGLVEVDAVAAMGQQVFGALGIQAHAVVGTVGHHRVDRLVALGQAAQRMAGDSDGDALRVELLGEDRPDDAVAIARRRHVHRQAAAEHQALLDGLVAVAVAQGKLVLADAGHEDGAV